jgi:predicted ArsR family transcriptional regulator
LISDLPPAGQAGKDESARESTGDCKGVDLMEKQGSELRTRDAIVESILKFGPATAKQLSDRLEITPAGIRRHLDNLVADSILLEKEPYPIHGATPTRGRPSKVFVMTDAGRQLFEHSYDDLAISALDFMKNYGGEELIRKFASTRTASIKQMAAEKSTSPITPDQLVTILNSNGFISSSSKKEHGTELCQRHCPVAHVASKYPELCEEETAVFSELLGTHVQRLATIAHGEGVCTTFIPANANLVHPNQTKKNISTSAEPKRKASLS